MPGVLVLDHKWPCEVCKCGWGIEGDVTRGLGHVDLFRQVTMKESILYIYLSNTPTSRNSYRKNSTYRGWFDDGTVSLIIIDPWLLMKALLLQGELCIAR
jgi:hypothetical protein